MGLGTDFAISRMKFLSEGTAEAEKSGPETATSTLKYATALLSCCACCSTHSVDPIRPSSSASQLQKMIERFGFHPSFNSAPTPCTASSMLAVPLLGSTAPYTQASR